MRLFSMADLCVLIVAGIEAMIALVEMLCRKLPLVHKRFNYSAEDAAKAAPIVANAGLYNGFLAVGLAWGALGAGSGSLMTVYLLSCIVIAGIFGAVTLKWTTLVLQTAPAAVALLAIRLSHG